MIKDRIMIILPTLKIALIPSSASGDVKCDVYDKTNFKPIPVQFPEWDFFFFFLDELIFSHGYLFVSKRINVYVNKHIF